MKGSILKNTLLLLLILFACRLAQDLFNPYITFDSYTTWKLCFIALVDAVTLTIGLTIGGCFYTDFDKQWQKVIKIITIILFIGCFAYLILNQSFFLSETLLSFITIIVSAAWKTGLLMAGLIILIGITRFIFRRATKQKPDE